MPVRIRPFNHTDADFKAWVAVGNAAFPERQETVQRIKEHDAAREDHVRIERFVAERDGHVIGIGLWGHMAFMFDPRRLKITVGVRPEESGRGVGRQLFDTALEAAEAACQPVSLRAFTREDRHRAVRFLEERGFEVEARGFESRLDIPSFDPSIFDGAIERVTSAGIRLASMDEARDDDEFEAWLRGVYDVDVEASQDIPGPEPITIEGWDSWRAHVVSSTFFRRGFQLALDGEQVVGVSMLFNAVEPEMLSTGLTGVLRSHRRRGIALALKLRAMEVAREMDVRTVRTHNDEPNRAMLSINEAMGFEKQPAFLDLYRSLRPDEDEHLARRAAAQADQSGSPTVAEPAEIL